MWLALAGVVAGVIKYGMATETISDAAFWTSGSLPAYPFTPPAEINAPIKQAAISKLVPLAAIVAASTIVALAIKGKK